MESVNIHRAYVTINALSELETLSLKSRNYSEPAMLRLLGRFNGLETEFELKFDTDDIWTHFLNLLSSAVADFPINARQGAAGTYIYHPHVTPETIAEWQDKAKAWDDHVSAEGVAEALDTNPWNQSENPPF